MLKILLVAFLFLGNVKSHTRPEEYQPNAKRTCEKHYDEEQYFECLDIIRDKTFNNGAIAYCSRHRYPSALNLCLKTTAGQYYQDDAIDICGWMQFSSYFHRCLEATANKTYKLEEIKECKSLKGSLDKTVFLENHGQVELK